MKKLVIIILILIIIGLYFYPAITKEALQKTGMMVKELAGKALPMLKEPMNDLKEKAAQKMSSSSS